MPPKKSKAVKPSKKIISSPGLLKKIAALKSSSQSVPTKSSFPIFKRSTIFSTPLRAKIPKNASASNSDSDEILSRQSLNSIAKPILVAETGSVVDLTGNRHHAVIGQVSQLLNSHSTTNNPGITFVRVNKTGPIRLSPKHVLEFAPQAPRDPLTRSSKSTPVSPSRLPSPELPAKFKQVHRSKTPPTPVFENTIQRSTTPVQRPTTPLSPVPQNDSNPVSSTDKPTANPPVNLFDPRLNMFCQDSDSNDSIEAAESVSKTTDGQPCETQSSSIKTQNPSTSKLSEFTASLVTTLEARGDFVQSFGLLPPVFYHILANRTTQHTFYPANFTSCHGKYIYNFTHLCVKFCSELSSIQAQQNHPIIYGFCLDEATATLPNLNRSRTRPGNPVLYAKGY